MSVLLQDLRFALRMLVKSPAFTAVAVVTLALGIGANTAIFSLINVAVLRPLPFAEPDRLVRVFRQSTDGNDPVMFSYHDYIEYRDRNDSFDEFAAFSFVPLSVGIGDANEMRFGQIVTGNYFSALDVDAIKGRMLTKEDDETPGAHPVVVLSYRYWQRAYGGRPDVIGETITLSAYPFTVVGVAPKGFSGAMPIPSPDLWAPMTMLAQIRPESRDQLSSRGAGFLWTLGRLKSGISIQQAQARLAVTASQLKEIDPEHYETEMAQIMPSDGIIPMTPGIRRTVLAISTLVMCMVALVLVIACANVANLLLARCTVRRRELAIRLSLGASRWRVVRQLLTESLLLALLGGAVGLLLAIWTMDLLTGAMPTLPFNVALDLDFGVDSRMLAFTFVASVITGVLFGTFPAFGSTKVDLVSSLKDEIGAGMGVLKRSLMRNTLVVGQVAISLMLLVGAGLFVRSLMSAQAIDPGFEHEQVLTVALDMGARDYDEAAGKAFLEQLLQRTRMLPGVESASIEDCPPLSMTMSSNNFWVEGRSYTNPDDELVAVAQSTVSDDNFETLGIPLLRGRDFTDQDTVDAPAVVIVNKAFADRYWPTESPLGKRISREGPQGPFLEVIGVVQTVKYWMIGEEPRPYIYFPLARNYQQAWSTLLLRTSGDPMSALSPVRDVIRDLDPNMSPMDSRSMTDLIGFAMLPAKFAAVLFGLLGGLALLLASVGLYGVMSYAVTQRTREIGVRVAIGAQRVDVLRLVLKHGLILTMIGAVIGLAASLAGARLFTSLLYEISAVDPLTFIAVTLLLVFVSMLACYIPARRATRVDPMVALRHE